MEKKSSHPEWALAHKRPGTELRCIFGDKTATSIGDKGFYSRKNVEELEKPEIRNNEDSFMGLVCIEGNGSLKVDGVSTSVKQGESLLLPDHTDEFDVEGTMALLTIVIPTLISETQG